MSNTTAQKPFAHAFLSQYVYVPTLLPFTDKEIVKIDKELVAHEQIFLNPDIEKNLISKNELLVSFAISKAENSTLTLQEAKDVYEVILANEEYTNVAKKLKTKQKLTQKDYEKMEFFNIAKTFRGLSQHPFTINNLTSPKIQDIHHNLSRGLDIFAKYLPNFTVYKSGAWRDNNMIRVGTYTPAPFSGIGKGVKELVSWIKNNQNITSVALFHTALYALHPFNNGNKRVCRILEHMFFRDLGLNKKNLYSTSYYYHTQKARYYKYLLYSIERKNLNHFIGFVQEALVLSIISVVKTSLEAKRAEFLARQDIGDQTEFVLRPLIKRAELQFKNLFRVVRNKMARQTFVTYLQKAADKNIIIKRETGRTTYYSLNLKTPEEKTLKRWLIFAKQKLSYLPDDILHITN